MNIKKIIKTLIFLMLFLMPYISVADRTEREKITVSNNFVVTGTSTFNTATISNNFVVFGTSVFDKVTLTGNLNGARTTAITNVTHIQVYGTNDATLTGYEIHNNNTIISDGVYGGTKGFSWADTGTVHWSELLYPSEGGEFWYLFNHDSEEIPFTVSTGSRVAINKQANIMNYHAYWTNAATGNNTYDDISVGGTYIRPQQRLYNVTIASTGAVDTWKWCWSLNDGTTWSAWLGTNNCSVVPANADNGVTIAFDNTTGHSISDGWTFYAFSQLPQGTFSVIPTMFTEVITTTNDNDANPTWRDVTYDAAYSAGNPYPVLTSTNSATYVGKKAGFNGIYIKVVQPAIGVTLVSEYWNGAIWKALDPVTNWYYDGTLNLTQSGKRYWDKSTMQDWAKMTLTNKDSGYNLYWIRYRTDTNPTTNAMIAAMAPQTEKRFGVYSTHLDGQPTFYVDTLGATYANNMYKVSTNTVYTPSEYVPESRLQSALASLRSQIGYVMTNAHPVFANNRSMWTAPGTVSWTSTNVLAAGLNTGFVYVATNTIGTTNIAGGSAFTFEIYASKTVDNRAVELSAQLLEVGTGITNILASGVTNAMTADTLIHIYPINIVVNTSTNVASGNYLAVRLIINRTGGANNLLFRGGANYPSALNYPVSGIGTYTETDPIAIPAIIGLGLATTNNLDGKVNGANGNATNLNVVGTLTLGSGTNVLTTDPVIVPTILVSAPTVTITRANGMYLALDCTNNVVLQVNTNDIPNAAKYRFWLDVRMNANSLTWDTNYFMSTNLATMATNVYVPVMGIRPYGGGLIEIR